MPTSLRAVPAVLTGVLLLAACGSGQSPSGDAPPRGRGAEGGVHAEALCPSQFPQYGSAPSDGRPTPAGTPSGTPSALPLPADDSPEDGVKVTGVYSWAADNGCDPGVTADIEVTNRSGEEATYTVVLGYAAGAGGMGDNVEHVVESVGAGRTVRSTVSLGEAAQVSDVKILKVRSVPTGEAPSASGPCPASGLHVYADQGDAAMGLRVVGLHLVNCSKRPYELDGYPELELLDNGRRPVDGIRILHGTEQISTGIGGEGPPAPVVLQPGEAALTTLAWRNTTEFGEPVDVPYVRVRPRPGDRPVMVTPELDLGTTGRLGVGPWRKDDTYRSAG
ncbi:DUF4232 domain-containing protein [Streptomyces sp. enrichment culture]|uniref:DUF4232 domain-containing protein n=1 Tax=Streptomyces sp. enrichment culture TaxID=1795815 RepID=UPI003F550CD7